MTPTNEKDVPKIQIIKIDEVSTSESELNQGEKEKKSDAPALTPASTHNSSATVPSASVSRSSSVSSFKTVPTTASDADESTTPSQSSRKASSKTSVTSSSVDVSCIRLPETEVIKGAWTELKAKLRRSSKALQAKHQEILAPSGPTVTVRHFFSRYYSMLNPTFKNLFHFQSTPASKSSSLATTAPPNVCLSHHIFELVNCLIF